MMIGGFFQNFKKLFLFLTAGDGAQVKEMVIEDKSDDTPTAVFIMGKQKLER